MHGEKRLFVKLVDGTRTQSQKRLVLANLKEIYKMFKEMHSTKNLAFQNFITWDPRIIIGSEKWHFAVCVCTFHQNVKLMLNVPGINKFVLEGNGTTLEVCNVCLVKLCAQINVTKPNVKRNQNHNVI